MYEYGRPGSDTVIAVELERLTPQEIVSLYGYLIDRDRADSTEMTALQCEAVDAALDSLIQRNPGEAELIFDAFIESRLPRDRENASEFLGSITLVHHGYGLRAWHDLITDHEPSVRQAAYQVFDEAASMPTEVEAVEKLGKFGLSVFDALKLTTAYLKAEQGLNLRTPGEEAAYHVITTSAGQIAAQQALEGGTEAVLPESQ